ncbi:MAG: NUDIX domain-containing protein [Agathobacter sp.]|uniref:NUDIX domain-containing protein n=1 Tax=Agathobacter sp. TaxID=2021311 RepID=UPI00258CED02|nr:NUDIX domain-containing protein [Agathobacter sp.]MCR5677734.1 NUDIX domain-containing protein [Agathobacter sp.]
METLFTLDKKDYSPDMPIQERHAVRGIIERDGKFIMQQSKEGDFKIPGGGIEPGETHVQALAREVREEVGLLVIPESVRPIGEIVEKRRDIFDPTRTYIAHSYFYVCDVGEQSVEPQMTESELRLGYHPVWEDLEQIIETNDRFLNQDWQKRDHLFMRWMRDRREKRIELKAE